MGWLKSRQGDAHSISPYGFSPSKLKSAPSQPSEGRSVPRAVSLPTPWRSATVCTRGCEAAGPPDPTPQEPTPAAESADSGSEATRGAARARRQEWNCGPSSPSPRGDRESASAKRRRRRCQRDSSPGVQTHPGPYLRGQRRLRPEAPAVVVAADTVPSAVTPLIKTTTCSRASAAGRRRPAERRSACWDS